MFYKGFGNFPLTGWGFPQSSGAGATSRVSQSGRRAKLRDGDRRSCGPVTPPSRGAIRASGGRSSHWNEGGPELGLWGAASPGREAGGGHVMGSSSRHTPSMWPGTNRRSWTQQTQCVQVIPPTANGARWVRSRRRPAQGLHPCSSQWFLKVFRKFGVPGDCTPALAHGLLMF